MNFYCLILILLLSTPLYSFNQQQQATLRDNLAIQTSFTCATVIALTNFLISKCLLEHWRKQDCNTLLEYIENKSFRDNSCEAVCEFYKHSPELHRNSIKQFIAKILAHPTTFLAIESILLGLLHLILAPQQPIRYRYVVADTVASVALALGIYKVFDLIYNSSLEEKNKIRTSIFERIISY